MVSTPAKVLLITGLGRCGSSLVLQMLAAGGVKVVGAPPFHEVHPERQDSRGRWLEGHEAAKWLGPGLTPWRPPPQYDYRYVWLDREPRHQIHSRCKFEVAAGIAPEHSFSDMAKMYARLSINKAKCLQLVNRLSKGNVVRMTFEHLLEYPHDNALRLQDAMGRDLDIKAMGAAVHRRGPECLKGFLEDKLRKA